MPERLLRNRTTSFIGFVGIFICAMIGLAHLPGLGAAESAAHGLAWIGVILAAVIMGRAWWNLAPEIFGGRMPLLGFVLLVNIVTVAIVSTPMFGWFGADRLNTFVTYFPFVWLPAVLVTAALMGHVLVWRWLSSGRPR